MPVHAQAMKLLRYPSWLKKLQVDDVDVVVPVSYWSGDVHVANNVSYRMWCPHRSFCVYPVSCVSRICGKNKSDVIVMSDKSITSH